MDTTQNTIDFFTRELLPRASKGLVAEHNFTPQSAEKAIRSHIRLCYDVCHFAVMFEDPATSIRALQEAGIGIGRVQLSAALKAPIPPDGEAREALAAQFAKFADSTYLHQVAARHRNGRIEQFPDLSPALATIGHTEATEWRSHFHVPLFVNDYGALQSTQEEIVKTLHLLKEKPFTQHLEVETYTWDVLPPDLKLDLHSSVRRELEWVLQQYGSA